jgi:O-antigen/teichoic acid export membrane protein
MRRVIKALVSNGLFSGMSLLLSVVTARSGGTEELGMFGVAFAAYLLVQLVVRDAGANTLSAALPHARKIRLTASRISFMGLVLALPIVLGGLLINQPYLVLLGCSIHGICLYDYSKTLSLSLGDGLMALMQDGVLFVLFLIATGFALAGHLSALGLWCVWCFGSALLGYLASFIQSYRIRPAWTGEAQELKTSLGFGFQSFIGSGSVHLLTFLLVGVGGTTLVGSMRGASTIMGPANLVTSSLQPLLITWLARTAPRPGAVSTPAVVKSSLRLVLANGLVTTGLVVLGLNFGASVMGDSWSKSAPLLIIVALDSVLVAVGAAPQAAHRSLWKSKRVAYINTWIVAVRIPLVIILAVLWGAQGAVLGFMIVTFGAAIAWWSSLASLQRA